MMRSLVAIATLLLIITVYESCHIIDDSTINAVCPGNCTTIQGRFTTRDGNIPAQGVNIHFDWITTGTLKMTSRTRKIATARTDAHGNYSMTFFVRDEELTDGSFFLHFGVPDNTYLQTPEDDYDISIPIVNKDTVITKNFHLPRLGSVIHIRLMNPEALGPADRLFAGVVFQYGDLNGNQTHALRALETPGLVKGTYPIASDQNIFIRILKVKDGRDTVTTDTVIVPWKQALQYNVRF